MRNIFLVIKYEIHTILSKRSFWITTFLFPAAILALNIGAQLLSREALDQDTNALLPSWEDESGAAQAIGYVDEAGLIGELPETIPPGLLQPFAGEAAAVTALNAGEIDKYYLVPATYLSSGRIILVDNKFQPLADNDEGLMTYVINYSLTGDAGLATVIGEPLAILQTHNIAPDEPAADNEVSGPLTFFVPYATLLIFFFLLTMSSGFMLRSVSREKENRVVEVLLLSLDPRELILGKIMGLSVVALLQMVVWVGGGALVLSGRLSFFDVGAFTLPDGFVLWAALYFIVGYLLYASLMGAIGALAPSAREGGQFTFAVMLPLMIPLFTMNAFITEPNGGLAVFLSLFPLTAPIAMMTRLAATNVPWWQLALAFAGLTATTYLFILIAARFFRADNLLSLAPLRWQGVVGAWRRS